MRLFYVLFMGVFLMGLTDVFGQNIASNPVGNKIEMVTDTTYYEHEYNLNGLQQAAEKTDTVTVTSKMPYFVMPDDIYNTGYFNQTNYQATNLTTSQFLWTIDNANGTAGTIAPRKANTTSTSPWVMITWTNVTASGKVDTIRMVEKPDISGACDGDQVKIPVVVIKRPEIIIGTHIVTSARDFTECIPDALGNTVSFAFPVTKPASASVISQSRNVQVTYTLKYTPLSGTSGSAYTTSGLTASVDLVSGTFTHSAPFNEHGTYEITITGVSDHISRKSSVAGIIGTAAENVFTYMMLPQPKKGRAYHIPNNP